MYYSLLSLFILSVLLQPGVAFGEQDSPQKSTAAMEKVSVEDVIPLTAASLRGHKMLYNEGWHLITSSSKAFDYAREKSIISSRTALRQIADDASRHSVEQKEAVKADVKDSVNTGKDLVATGTDLSGRIFKTTQAAAKAELDYSRDSFKKAMGFLVRGNLSIAKRTESERAELAGLPGDYFKALKSDFNNIFELAESAREKFTGDIEPAWESAFQKASREFQEEYEKSGSEKNSLMALGPILYGYLKAFYHGLAAPASKTIVKTGVTGASYAVFLPVAATSVVTGRTVQSVGLTVYYTGKTGVKIISPTVEGGLLSGLSILSLGAVPVTYVAGGTLGAVNQVAFSTAGPVAGTAQAAVSTTAHSAAYVGFLAYDAAKGTTKVVINQAASGIVLGYNALTAVPTHALIGVMDTAVFLAWDGPRLVIAAARGRIKTGKDSGDSYSIGELPVGTVVDMKKLENVEGVKVDIISTDTTVIKEVLEKIPDDARTSHEDAH